MSDKGMTTRQISNIIEDIYERMHAVAKKWHDRYPNAMKRRQESLNSAILPTKNRYFVIEKSNLHKKTSHAPYLIMRN